MTDEERKEGAAATLRAALLIVIAGALLGVGYNALARVSHPPRGLTWTPRVEKMPSLEELQSSPPAPPAPDSTPARGSSSGVVAPQRGIAGTLLVLAVATPPRAPVLSAADGNGGTSVPPAPRRVVKKAKKKTATTTGSPRAAAPPGAAQTPPAAAPPAAAPAAAKVDLPTVPDLDQPIEVKLPNVKKFFDAQAAVFVDAREAPEYAAGHVRGAVSVPFDDAVAKPALLEPFKKVGKPIIIYCSGGDCELSKNLAANMLAEGIRKVLVFTDGFPAWKAAGYPIESGAASPAR
jgi:rhodanese-related sulfurtransferase